MKKKVHEVERCARNKGGTGERTPPECFDREATPDTMYREKMVWIQKKGTS